MNRRLSARAWERQKSSKRTLDGGSDTFTAAARLRTLRQRTRRLFPPFPSTSCLREGAAFRVPARLILPFCLISSTSGATETSAPTTPTSSVSGANEGHPNRPSSRHHSKDERTPISREDRRRTWGTQRQASTRVSFSCTRHPSANALSSLQLAPSLPFTLAVMF